jgi:bifunctional non-homologous end joining protein LigD
VVVRKEKQLRNPVRTMPLVRIPEPFDNPDWLFELKHDGFRALAQVEGQVCTLLFRRGHTFTKFKLLAAEIAHTVRLMEGTASR